jgi:phage gp36-like protein
VSQYATLAELYVYGAPSVAFGTITLDALTVALQSASTMADSFIRSRYALPLTAWGTDLKMSVCKIATYEVMSVRGYNPAAGSDVNYLNRHLEAMAWLKGVSRGEIHLDVTPALSTASQGSGVVVSNSRRGW